jgi:hypothetical protein
MRAMSIADYVAVAKQIGDGRPDAVVDALRALSGSPESIADALRSHHLLGFVQHALRRAGATDARTHDLLTALASRRPIQRATPETLLETFIEVRRALDAHGIAALLLKGLHLAQRLYGGIDRRPQFDVDVLVRGRDLRRAVRVLAAHGFVPEAYDLHSRTVIREGLKIDLHGSLRWAPAYRLDEDALWTDARAVTIAGREVPTLSDEHTLLLLLLAAFEDLGQGTINLKQVLDVVLFVRTLEPTIDWRELLARRARENLLEVSVNVLAVVLDAFAMREAFPRLEAELARHEDRVRHHGRDEALALLGAAPKSAASLRWFARVYPGSMAHYIAWFWVSGFPSNLRQVGRSWVVQTMGLAVGSLRREGDSTARARTRTDREPPCR